MNASPVDELLADSRPQSLADDPRVAASIAALVADSRTTPLPRRASRRAWFVIPAVGLGALALTGGTLATDAVLTPDITIPLSYTTLAGETYSCTIDIDGGSLFLQNSKAAGDYLRSQDWTGVGQRIYDRAVQIRAAEFITDADGNFAFPPLDSQLVVTQEQLAKNDALTWTMAEAEQTVQTVPEGLVPSSDYTSQWHSDCSGTLL